jgi:hypothetical protein
VPHEATSGIPAPPCGAFCRHCLVAVSRAHRDRRVP